MQNVERKDKVVVDFDVEEQKMENLKDHLYLLR